jgi:hypothetical protein
MQRSPAPARSLRGPSSTIFVVARRQAVHGWSFAFFGVNAGLAEPQAFAAFLAPLKRAWPRRQSCWPCMLPHASPSPPTHHPLIHVLAHAAAAACASSKCSRAARRHDIGSRQPRSALTPHERAPHEHQRLPRVEPLARRRRRSPSVGAMLCPAAEPAKPERSAAFSPLSTTIRGGAWPAPEPSTAGPALPPTLEPASIPHSVPVGTGHLHHPRLRAWALLGGRAAQPHPSVADVRETLQT